MPLVKEVFPSATPRFCAKCGKALVYLKRDLDRYDTSTGGRLKEHCGKCPDAPYNTPHGGGDNPTWHTYATLKGWSNDVL